MRFEDAVRALREEGDAPRESAEENRNAEETRARVVATLERAKRHRSKRMFLVLPIAAVLAAASASAAVSDRLPSAWHSLAVALRLSPRLPGANEPRGKVAPPAPIESDARSQPIEPAETREADAVVVPAPVATIAARPAPKPARVPPAASGSLPVAERAVAERAVAERAVAERAASPGADSLVLYRTAHRLHFGGGDPSASLSAWDAYLRADPSGALALEARYNRALCLVRLGRRAEARDALTPFAAGTFGQYRKREARALLDVLDAETKVE